jgi:transposase
VFPPRSPETRRACCRAKPDPQHPVLERRGARARPQLTGYTGLCPRVDQSGEKDRRGPLTKHGPRYLRWALLEATMHALKHPAYAERYQRNKRRLGKQRGAKVAQIDIARRLAHAIWHMPTRQQRFAPRGAALRLAA